MTKPTLYAATNQGLSVRVDVDLGANTKTLSFNKPTTPQEASSFLWGNPGNAALLKPIGALSGGKVQEFRLETHDIATLMALKPEVRDALIQGSVVRSNGAPYDLPPWVPKNVLDDIRNQRLPRGVKHYPGPPEWGDIVVWTGNASVQVYMEFPTSIAFYSQIARDAHQAHLLHCAYTQYNKDMHHFVDERGFSPEDARAEIRRINVEVFKLIIEGAAALLNSGVGISQVNNAMRADAEQVANAARRSPRAAAAGVPGKIRPKNGCVNVGGTGAPREPQNVTNLNPVKIGSGGAERGIPNHVKAGMEEMAQVIEPGSVKSLTSSRLRFGDVRNWDAAARAAAHVMSPGGEVAMNVWCQSSERAMLKAAFERAGFRNVTITGEGVGTMLHAIR